MDPSPLKVHPSFAPLVEYTYSTEYREASEGENNLWKNRYRKGIADAGRGKSEMK